MKRKLWLISSALILSLSVSACGSHTHKSTSQKAKSALQANMSNKYNSPKNSAKESNGYSFKIPKNQLDSRNFVKNGDLTKPSQFTYDHFGTEQRLAKVNYSHQMLTSNGIRYEVLRAKVIKNTATTAVAKEAAKQALNLSSVPDTYYTFLVNYRVANLRNSSIALNGVKQVKTSNGQTLSISNQLNDSSAGARISSDSTQEFSMVGYLYDYSQHPSDSISILFGNIYTPNGSKVANGPSESLNIQF